MSSIEWAAGLLEGEGSFVRKGANGVSVRCQMTDQDVLEKLSTVFGGRVIGPTKGKEAHWKDTYLWVLNGDRAVSCMEAILPHMGLRRSEKIRSLLELREAWRDEQEHRSESYALAVAAYLRGEGTVRSIASEYGVVWGTLARKVRETKRV